jgi:hypothetical protein
MMATVPCVARTNGYAIASLVCGFGQFLAGPLAIFAIVFGYTARRQLHGHPKDADPYA